MRTLSLLFVLAMFFTSCQSGAENSEAEQTNEAAAPEQEAPALKYTLSAFSPSDTVSAATGGTFSGNVIHSGTVTKLRILLHMRCSFISKT